MIRSICIMMLVVRTFIIACQGQGARWDYGMSIDAGSTGTRIYLYRWIPPTPYKRFVQPQTRPEWTFKLNQGISSFAGSPDDVGPFLKPLIDFAVDRLTEEGVSKLRFKQFPIYLKATAGMRVLRYSQRDGVMSSIRLWLHNNAPFWFDDSMARVISGQEEGVYAWLTINYMKQTLFAGARSIGTLDMGGASTQITFRPVHDIIAEFFPVRLNSKNIRLYSHSFLLFGVKEARRRLRVAVVQEAHDRKLPVDSRQLARHMRQHNQLTTTPAPQAVLPFTRDQLAADAPYNHPCYAAGWLWTESLTGEGETTLPTQFVGTSNFTACLDLALTLLPTQDDCYTHSCAFGGVYLPRILNNSFVAISYYTESIVDQLRLPATPTLTEIQDRTRELCELPQTALRDRFPTIPDPSFFCVNAVWALAILRYGYRFNMDTRQITFLPDPGALGAILYEANLLEPRPVGSNGGVGTHGMLNGDELPPLTWSEALLGTSYWTLLLPSFLAVTTIIALVYVIQLRTRLASLGYSWPSSQDREE